MTNVEKYFPDSLLLKELEKKVNKILKKNLIYPKNTLLATSNCSDLLNKRIEKQFENKWGQSFMLGGLGGIPFTSISGIDACVNNVPEGGNLFIIYSTHIGIDENGILGVIESNKTNTCCQSILNAYYNPEQKRGDYQKNFIINKIMEKSQILTQDGEQNIIMITNIIRREIKKIIRNLIQELTIPVIILGGININTKEKDYFQPYEFCIYKNGEYRALI